MRTAIFIVSALMLAALMLTSFVQPKMPQKNQPKVVYQVGHSKIVVWENARSDGRIWKNFQVEKTYQKEGKWATTNSFNETELLELRAALDKAINEELIIIKSNE